MNEIKRGDQERVARDLAKKLSDVLKKIPNISNNLELNDINLKERYNYK